MPELILNNLLVLCREVLLCIFLDRNACLVQENKVAYDEVIKLPDVTVVVFEFVDEAFQALKDGTLDAVISDFPGTAYYYVREGKKNFKIVGDTIINQPIAIAFFQSNSQLPSLVNNALAKLKESGEFARIYKQWFGVEPPQYLPGNIPNRNE